MAGERLTARLLLLRQLWLAGQESALKPPQAICKPLGGILTNEERTNNIYDNKRN